MSSNSKRIAHHFRPAHPRRSSHHSDYPQGGQAYLDPVSPYTRKSVLWRGKDGDYSGLGHSLSTAPVMIHPLDQSRILSTECWGPGAVLALAQRFRECRLETHIKTLPPR